LNINPSFVFEVHFGNGVRISVHRVVFSIPGLTSRDAGIAEAAINTCSARTRDTPQGTSRVRLQLCRPWF
jgi:hypothetical protein